MPPPEHPRQDSGEVPIAMATGIGGLLLLVAVFLGAGAAMHASSACQIQPGAAAEADVSIPATYPCQQLTARPSQENTSTSAQVNAAVGKVLAYARAQLGKPYIWGAQGPDAFDCSGLTMMAYRAAGITIPRVTYDQWRHGTRIPRGREQPGDLVFFRMQARGPGHVGLVIGNNMMINARCRTCRPGVALQPYTGRRDLVGFTRVATAAPTNSSG